MNACVTKSLHVCIAILLLKTICSIRGFWNAESLGRVTGFGRMDAVFNIGIDDGDFDDPNCHIDVINMQQRR